MWPLYLLFSKFLKTEEENNQGAVWNHLNLVDSYPFKLLLSKEKVNHEALSNSNFIEVPHVNQLYTWDCGLACVVMILQTLHISSCDINDLEEICCTTSIWTVDLAYLLQKFSIRFSYFTVTLGANPNFSVESYYKDQLSNDLVRVNMLFQKARDAGINIECRSISGEDISLLILSGKYIAIALVDQYKLRLTVAPFLCCDSFCSQSWLQDVCISSLDDENPGYTGHYIIVCGYDSATDEFEIRDPASSRKHEMITSRRLDDARKAFGTDEDLLLISLEKEENRNGHLLSLPPPNYF